MHISGLIHNIPILGSKGPPDTDVTGLSYDSRQVRPGTAFFALRGAVVDGHDFVAAAIKNGASTVFLEKDLPLPNDVTAVLVANCRKAMAQAAINFYANPTADMTLVGVTGTNGKTTVCYQLEAVFRAAGRRPAVIGTVNYRFGERVYPAPNTTPESVDLFRILAEFRQAGADTVIMEVSSHGLDQHRIDGLGFDVGIFTNLSAEHLDYHVDMESYFAVKKRFFHEFIKPDTGISVVNIDDPYGLRLARELKRVWRSGRGQEANIRLGEIKTTFSGTDGFIDVPPGRLHLRSRLFGSYNISNLMVTAGAALAAGVEAAIIEHGLAGASQVPGRLEPVSNDRGAVILVDYAHTPDALRNVLSALRDLRPRRLIALFGCGGDRDHAKRPAMGEIAAKLADFVILTSDNPRSEDPQAIIEEIRSGIEAAIMPALSRAEGLQEARKGFVTIADREEAIIYAVSLLFPGDVLVVAGKGHEDYQIIGKHRRTFKDRDKIIHALAAQEVPS